MKTIEDGLERLKRQMQYSALATHLDELGYSPDAEDIWYQARMIMAILDIRTDDLKEVKGVLRHASSNSKAG